MRRIVVPVALVAVALTAPLSMAASAAARARDQVVASFYPLAWVARAVGGPAVLVTDLTPSGAEPHDLELTTDGRDAIEDADLALVMGHDFQPAVQAAADDRGGPTLKVLDRIDVGADAADSIGRRRSAPAPPAAVGEAAASGRDPHVWLDPVLMQQIVRAVERALARVDPSRAAVFEKRANATLGELDTLDNAYRTRLADCDRRLLVTAHEAFGWLAERYDLREQGIAGIDPEAEPDPKRLGELADLARREGVTTVFTEELVSPKVARTLAREAGGLKTEVLSPLESLSDAERSRGDDYVDVMTANLTKLRRALGCR